ncbi:MAG: YdeI/OmpD-associated family protein [Gemmatimonadaceae bacterium]
MVHTLRVKTVVERHHPGLPRLVTIALATVAKWGLTETTTIEGTINGTPLGRRSIKRWDDRKCWWIDLPEPLCRKAGVDVGDMVQLELRLADEALPDELATLLQKKPAAKKAWDALTTNQQRTLREEVAAAKQSTTRRRRAERALAHVAHSQWTSERC